MSTAAIPPGASRRQPPASPGAEPPATEPGDADPPGEAPLEGVDPPGVGRTGEESVHESGEDDRLGRDRGRGPDAGEQAVRESSADDRIDTGREADPDAPGLDAP